MHPSHPTTNSDIKREVSEQRSRIENTPSTAPNILIFGETGVGKSSVINMLAGKDIAETSGDALGYTFENTRYTISISSIDDTENTKEITVWDTAGLNEDKHGTVSPEKAAENLRRLIKSLGSGLNLLVYVVRGWRLSKVIKPNYDIFVTGICQGKVPVVLIVTGCEDELPMEKWWSQNKEVLDAHRLHFQDHACITSSRGKLKGGVYLLEEEYQESEKAVRRVVVDNLLTSPWVEDDKRWMEVTKAWLSGTRMFKTPVQRQIAGPQSHVAGQKTNGKEEKREIGNPSHRKGYSWSFGRFGTFTWEPEVRITRDEINESEADGITPGLYHQPEGQLF